MTFLKLVCLVCTNWGGGRMYAAIRKYTREMCHLALHYDN